MGHCFSEVVVVSEKKYMFFFTFLNWEKRTWYRGNKWLFSNGNGAEIRTREKGRKSPANAQSTFVVEAAVFKLGGGLLRYS